MGGHEMVPKKSVKNIFIKSCIANIIVTMFSFVSFASSEEYEVTNHNKIDFCGYTWEVTNSESNKWAPGPNFWSNSDDNVWVDRDGKLHLRITNKNGVWHSAEVVNTQTLGHGTYRFYIEGRPDQLDPNVVFGLFTYDGQSDDAPDKHYREIDIEFIKWGDPEATNLAYTVQPYTRKQNMAVINAKLYGTYSTHSFNWKPHQIDFLSVRDHHPAARKLSIVNKWSYKGKDIPGSKNEKVDINLWLYQGKPPINKKEIEMVITKFEFIPYIPKNIKIP
jgi:hypothetical protein